MFATYGVLAVAMSRQVRLWGLDCVLVCFCVLFRFFICTLCWYWQRQQWRWHWHWHWHWHMAKTRNTKTEAQNLGSTHEPACFFGRSWKAVRIEEKPNKFRSTSQQHVQYYPMCSSNVMKNSSAVLLTNIHFGLLYIIIEQPRGLPPRHTSPATLHVRHIP